MTDTIGVVVVSYGAGDTLDAFLDTLAHATKRPVQVVIADNGSTDDGPERAGRRDGVTLLPTGGNLGYGRAANLGAAAVEGDWLVLANPDVTWTPGAIDELLAVADRWPRAGALGPLIRDEHGKVYPSARELPSFLGGIGHALFGWWWPGNPWTRAYRNDRAEPSERTAGWLSGSCLLVRRTAFDSVGGFDPGYFMYFEDVDLGERMTDAGWLNVYAPSAEIVHLGGHSTEQHKSAMFLEHHRSAYRYLSGRYPGRRGAPARLLLRTGLAARARLTPPLIAFAARMKGKK